MVENLTDLDPQIGKIGVIYKSVILLGRAYGACPQDLLGVIPIAIFGDAYNNQWTGSRTSTKYFWHELINVSRGFTILGANAQFFKKLLKLPSAGDNHPNT